MNAADNMAEGLLKFIQYELASGLEVGEVRVDDDLIELNFIDSLGVMRLLEFIETEYGIEVPIEEVVVENFYTVQAMTMYLQELMASRDG